MVSSQQTDTPSLTASQCRWLLGDQAKDLLERTAIMHNDGADVAKIAKVLRQLTTPENTHLIISQNRCRQRARNKFQLADQMFFTEQGLEQSSGDLLANYKASRLASDRVCDLCTGVGGDAMALAANSDLLAVDRCESTAIFAKHNILLSSQQGVRVEVAAAESISVNEFDAWHLDPDQRFSGRRSRLADDLSPGLEAISRLVAGNRNGCVKLSPLTEVPTEWLREHGPVEIEYLGDRRECKQKLLWFGDEVDRHRIRATIVASDGSVDTISHDNDAMSGIREPSLPLLPMEPGMFLFEPHAVVIASGLVDRLGAELDLMRIEESVAYLCGGSFVSHPALAAFAVVDISPADSKHIRRMLRRHDARIAEWKKRGVDHRLMESFRKLKPGGEVPHTLFVTKVGSQRRAILARRLASESTSTDPQS